MQCPSCGASNPDSAQWCGQCLHRFGSAAARTPQGPSAVAAPAAATEDVAQEVQPGGPAPAAATSGSFRRQGDDLEWACAACGQFNSIDLLHCGVCGTAFVEQFRDDAVEAPRNWSQAFALSALAPGAGHLAVGRYGSGAARLLLFLTWTLGAIMLAGGGGRRALIAVAPLLVGAATVYVLSLVDVRRLERGQPELLAGRRLLWLVLAVLGLLGIGLVGSLVSAAT